jgi:hypothetical protein
MDEAITDDKGARMRKCVRWTANAILSRIKG